MATAPTTDATSKPRADDQFRGVLVAAHDHLIELGLPGTDYRLKLTCSADIDSLKSRIGKRLRGTIHAKALRMFKANGGGRFIEPIWGEPRIVAGVVLAMDESRRRVLVDVAVPMWMTLDERQPADAFTIGDLVNCYVASGTVFEPAEP